MPAASAVGAVVRFTTGTSRLGLPTSRLGLRRPTTPRPPRRVTGIRRLRSRTRLSSSDTISGTRARTRKATGVCAGFFSVSPPTCETRRPRSGRFYSRGAWGCRIRIGWALGDGDGRTRISVCRSSVHVDRVPPRRRPTLEVRDSLVFSGRQTALVYRIAGRQRESIRHPRSDHLISVTLRCASVWRPSIGHVSAGDYAVLGMGCSVALRTVSGASYRSRLLSASYRHLHG